MYCSKVEPAESFISSKSAFKELCEILGHYCPGVLPFSPSENKKILAILINWNIKNALHGSITVKNLLSAGMDVSSTWGLGTTGCQSVTMLFIAPRSWINFHPWPLGFLTGKIGVLEELVQGIMRL